jgi:hypothetical protein
VEIDVVWNLKPCPYGFSWVWLGNDQKEQADLQSNSGIFESVYTGAN